MNTQAHAPVPTRGSRRQPDRSRKAILQAALVEFGREGLAGARVDAIAEAAGVNKALLYYYFHDKESLYGAVLDGFFERLLERVMTVCDRPGTAGERFLSYVKAHFDSIAESPYYAHIFMGELMSASRGRPTHLERVFAQYIQPVGQRIVGLLQEGIDQGEFRAVNPTQFAPSAVGSIVHYFLTAPLRRKFMNENPSSQAGHRRAPRVGAGFYCRGAVHRSRGRRATGRQNRCRRRRSRSRFCSSRARAAP